MQIWVRCVRNEEVVNSTGINADDESHLSQMGELALCRPGPAYRS